MKLFDLVVSQIKQSRTRPYYVLVCDMDVLRREYWTCTELNVQATFAILCQYNLKAKSKQTRMLDRNDLLGHQKVGERNVAVGPCQGNTKCPSCPEVRQKLDSRK